MIFIFRNVAFRTIFSDIVNWCAKFVEHSCIEKWSLSSMGISPINLDWNLGVEIVFEDTVTLLTVQSTISKEFYPTRRWWATKNTIENIKSFNYTFSSPATVFYCRVQNCSKWPHHEEITMTLTYEDERIASLLNSNSAGVGAILFFFLCFHSFCCFLLNVFRPTALFHGNMHWRCIGVAVIWLCLVLCMAKSKMRSKRRQT